MMHKRTLHSLLIVSFIVAFASTLLAADAVIVQNKAGLLRCVGQSATVTANIDGPNAISALEVVLRVSNTTVITFDSVTWGLPTDVLADRFIDVSDYPVLRFAAMSTGQTPDYYTPGTGKAVATIFFHTKDIQTGSVDIAGYVIPAAPPLGAIQTQFVDAVTGDLRLAAVTTGTISVANVAPTIDAVVNPGPVLFGHLWTTTLVGHDQDMPNGCETLTYFIQQGPPGMTIASGSDVVNWTPTAAQVCYDLDIIVGVRDKYQTVALAPAFKICVQNRPPVFTQYPTAPAQIAYGDTYSTTLLAVDPDPGPYGPIYSLIGWAYPQAAPDLDGNTGVLTWNTADELPFGGIFNVKVVATDNANVCDPCSPSNADTVEFQIKVMLLQISISKEEKVFLGQERVVNVNVSDNTFFNTLIGGFDFLIQYDNSAMMFQQAVEGDFITACEWEYFTYRFGASGNCGAGACPSGVLRVVAMGESTGGNLAHHPCDDPFEAGDNLVKLHFLVSSDANLECQFAAIRFVWYDCADNGISNKEGDTLYISKEVWDFSGFDVDDNPIYTNITGMDQTFPTLTGVPNIDECDVSRKGHPWRVVHFNNGGLDLICADSIDMVGDINLNAIAYEIADAVMFTNYFVVGMSAFGEHGAGSIAASDTNKDGLTLTVADLVYLIRVIVGDAVPYNKVTPTTAKLTVGNGIFSVDQPMGAALVVVSGNVTPTLLADNMKMDYGFNGENTNIIVYSYEANQTFSGSFLRADGQVVKTELATYYGQPVVAKVMPSDFALRQNYPNPFNPATKIEILIPREGVEWKLNIYNITGQLVESFSGVSQSGFESVVWDASGVSSGVYFYKLTAGDFSDTKKAVFLK